jgi:hypothetical protein
VSTWYSCGFMFAAHVPEDLALPIQLAGGVRIERVPEWAKHEDATRLESWSTRNHIEECDAAFVTEFEAPALDSGAQKAAETIFLAGLAMWLAQPTGWSPAHITHFGDKGHSDSVRQTGDCSILRVSENHSYDVPTQEAFKLAAELHGVILALPRDGTVWASLRYLTIAIPEHLWEPRYAMMWVALESLFGPEDGREITYRMSQRAGLFLGRDTKERAEIFRIARAGYGMRSKVVHGGRLASLTPEKSGEFMLQAESLARSALVKLLKDRELCVVFDSGGREQYLDELAFR